MARRALSVAVVAVALGRTAAADVLDVPADYPTIQAAIEAAIDGDEVIVAPGTWVEQIDFLGKAISVRSSAGAEATSIDARQSGRVVAFQNGEGPDSVLQGFRITGGIDDPGAGGIVISGSSPAISDCDITGNSGFFGGAVACLNLAAPTFTRCRFVGNVSGILGGAIFTNAGSSLSLEDCVFVGNYSSGNGGAVAALSGPMTAIRCTFSNNLCEGQGGGIVSDHSIVAFDCTFVGNKAPTFGGGGMSFAGADLQAVNCLFAANVSTSATGGGGILTAGSTTALVNATFVDNSGSGIVSLNSPIEVQNSIFWGNAPAQLQAPFPEVTFTNVQGCCPGGNNINADPLFGTGPSGAWTAVAAYDPDTLTTTYVDAGAGLVPGAMTGKFLRPFALSQLPVLPIEANTATTITVLGDFALFGQPGLAYSIEDYRLLGGSPCIDAASNAAVPPGTTTDLDGNPRLVDDLDAPDCPQSPGVCGIPPVVDMGAYEFQAPAARCFTVLQESLDCHPDGETFTWTVQGVNECTGALVTVVFTGSAGAPGEPACFSAEFHDGAGLCCEQTMCVAVTDCSGRPALAADIDGDGAVGIGDLLILLAAWGPCGGCAADIDADGVVGMLDLLALLANWGPSA